MVLISQLVRALPEQHSMKRVLRSENGTYLRVELIWTLEKLEILPPFR